MKQSEPNKCATHTVPWHMFNQLHHMQCWKFSARNISTQHSMSLLFPAVVPSSKETLFESTSETPYFFVNSLWHHFELVTQWVRTMKSHCLLLYIVHCFFQIASSWRELLQNILGLFRVSSFCPDYINLKVNHMFGVNGKISIFRIKVWSLFIYSAVLWI